MVILIIFSNGSRTERTEKKKTTCLDVFTLLVNNEDTADLFEQMLAKLLKIY